jgi:hypothetical protein
MGKRQSTAAVYSTKRRKIPKGGSGTAPAKTTVIDLAQLGAVEHKTVPLSEIHEDTANARRHPEANMSAITASLRRFGQVEPLIVQKSSQRVIGGNGRLAAMRSLGWTHCRIWELTGGAPRQPFGLALASDACPDKLVLPRLGQFQASHSPCSQTTFRP